MHILIGIIILLVASYFALMALTVVVIWFQKLGQRAVSTKDETGKPKTFGQYVTGIIVLLVATVLFLVIGIWPISILCIILLIGLIISAVVQGFA